MSHWRILGTLVAKSQTPAAAGLHYSAVLKEMLSLIQYHAAKKHFNTTQNTSCRNCIVSSLKNQEIVTSCVNARPDCTQSKPNTQAAGESGADLWVRNSPLASPGVSESRSTESNHKLLPQHVYNLKPQMYEKHSRRRETAPAPLAQSGSGGKQTNKSLGVFRPKTVCTQSQQNTTTAEGEHAIQVHGELPVCAPSLWLV